MTWRRFLILLRGLSGDAVTVVTAQMARTRAPVPTVTDPAEVSDALRRVLGGERKARR